MNRILIFATFAGALAGAMLGGCSGTQDSMLESSSDPTEPTDDTGTTSSKSTTKGVPCNVLAVLQNNGCLDCHGKKPTSKGISSLLTYANLTAVDTFDDKGRTVAEVSLARMKSTKQPMPPLPNEAASKDDISVFQKWIIGGYKGAACKTSASASDASSTVSDDDDDADGDDDDDGDDDSSIPVKDAGSTTTPPADSGTTTTPPDPFASPAVCTSGVFWTSGKNEKMRPGEACGGCHGSSVVAGTVYPTGHEPDKCNGSSAGAQIIITDKNGVKTTLTANTVGNFLLQKSIAKPYKAVVSYNGKTRAMIGAQTSTDCNSCHSQNGSSSAPGRIVLPL